MRSIVAAALLLGCSEQPPAPLRPHVAPQRPLSGPYHDPDLKRGALPSAADREKELAALREHLDRMYAHRVAKEQREGLDENAWFAELEKRVLAAASWGKYDTAIYEALARFHDSHLTYHPPSTAAPARGYTGFRLGITTVLAADHLLVAKVDADSDAATAGVKPGDEVIEIDGKPVADVLADEVATRVWSRVESAKASWNETWTSVLYPVGDKPRPRTIRVRARDGSEHAVAITPHEVPKGKKEAVTTTNDGGVAVVTIRTLNGGKSRAKAIDDALATARTSQGIVIDLRGDRGGVDLVGYQVVAGVAEGKARIGTYHVLVSPEMRAKRPRWKDLVAGPDGFSPPQEMTVDAQPTGKGFHGPLAVIVDAGCVSTCELVAAALRADVGAVVVGETTGGSSGAPLPVELPVTHGKIYIPTWNMIAADGKPIESDGVVPDVASVATPDALAAGEDLPLQTAIDLVRARLKARP